MFWLGFGGNQLIYYFVTETFEKLLLKLLVFLMVNDWGIQQIESFV